MEHTYNPSMHAARVDFDDTAIADVPGAVRNALDESGISIKPGARIAVTVGSRGIASLSTIVKAAVDWLRTKGAEPFIVPAMGSHGGATAEGQAGVLRSYGIDENTMGVPIRSSMETVRLDAGDLDTDLFMDRFASESDGILLLNRVKLHTDFHGFPESGLIKMSVIGLGKHDQAKAIHGRGIYGLTRQILPAARRIIGGGKVIGGLGIVENAYDKPLEIRASEAHGIEAMEREMLELAGKSMARLPLDDIDLLIVDEMGKDVSGSGLDTNIIGRIKIRGQAEPESPRVSSIVVTGLTEASHGNAIGIGLVDLITQDLYDSIDFPATYENGLTSSFSERLKVPYVAANHVEALHAGIRFVGLHANRERALEMARIVRIKNTLDLSSILVSPAAAEALRTNPQAHISEDAHPLLDENGRFSAWP